MMKSWRVLAGIAISGIFLYFAFRGQDFNAVKESFRQVNYWYLIPALALYLVGLAIRAYRWSVLIGPMAATNTRMLLPINAVGLMANNILPLRTGELVRAYVLSQKTGISKSAGLATIAVERIFDGLTMLLFIVVSMFFVTLTDDLEHVAALAFILFSIAIVGLFLLTAGGDLRDRALQLVLGPLPESAADRIETMAESFLEGLTVLKRRNDLVLVSLTSVIAWLFEASVYWTVAKSFGGDIASVMGIPETLLTTGVGNLATLIPSSPGYVGPFEAAIIAVLNGALGVSRELALSFAILIHALLYFPVTIWGLIEWGRMHLSLAQVKQMRTSPEGDTVATVLEESDPGHSQHSTSIG